MCCSLDTIVSLPPPFRPAQSLLGDETLQGKGSKLIAMPASTYHWESYSDMTERGLLDNIASVREARGSLPDYSDGVFASDDWKGKQATLVNTKSFRTLD